MPDQADLIQELLPSVHPVRRVAEDGTAVTGGGEPGDYAMPSLERLRDGYRLMVLGRRFDTQATALTKQGHLAVYPSSHGQEACQVGGVLALAERDWLFPTYRDCVALVARGLDPVEVLTLLRGDWHCGYDPVATRVAPQCTPLATQAVHAVGLAHALRTRADDAVVLAFVGDGATSEGDFHEALNFAGVFGAPVVFLVQNNKYAISVPLARQTSAPALAYKGIGYGIRSEQVDGNDLVAVLAVLDAALARARRGEGPFLIEAHTYRVAAHTNADDASRYRDDAEVARWTARDPIARLERYLRDRDALTDGDVAAAADAAQRYADELRQRMLADPPVRPLDLFDHVFAEPTPQLREQRELLVAELRRAEADGLRVRG